MITQHVGYVPPFLTTDVVEFQTNPIRLTAINAGVDFEVGPKVWPLQLDHSVISQASFLQIIGAVQFIVSLQLLFCAIPATGLTGAIGFVSPVEFGDELASTTSCTSLAFH